MNMKKISLAVALASLGVCAAGNAAAAGAMITNGTLTLGVNDLGALNVRPSDPTVTGTNPGTSVQGVSTVGLRFNTATGSYASTEPGCTCEGWGAAIQSSGVTGFQNTSAGTGGLSLVSFSSTASTATSVTTIGGQLEVTHFYHPSTTTNLYQVDVSIKNISGADLAAGDLVYRRVMDWDIEPTAFRELVTMAGVPATLGLAGGNNVRGTGDNGFASANPLSGDSRTISCPANSNFTKCGPADHGALFDFVFEALAKGATRSFTTYYGAAGTETDILAALSSVGAGLYSLGYNNRTASTDGSPAVFAFGFGSSGGVLTPPPTTDVPEPASLALLGVAAAGLGVMRRRKAA